ncbi:MAG: hypothetical protein AAB637_00955 [Patescibacteria group bacterium]
MTPDEQSRIEELKKSLYSRSAPDIRTKRRLRFTRQEMDMNTDWEHKEEWPREDVKLNTQYKDNSMSFFTKLFIGSIIFFLIALGIGLYLVFNGSNIVSANNIDITIGGPVSVAGGEPVSFDIQVSNKNNIKLETVDLSVDFPSGTTDSEDTTKELKTFRELLNDIEPGGIGQKTIKAVVYGEENSKKEIKVTVEYRVKGSNAIFQKEKTFDLLISSSPLTLLTNSFKEVNSSQEFELSVNMTSNSKEVIKNILLKAVYPFGFTFISSDTKPFSDNTVWKIGDIPPGGKKTIKIKGKLDGQDDETRIFRFITGAQSVRNEKVIGTEYVSSTQEVAIKKPFVSVGLSIEGNSDSQEYIGKFNNPIKVEVLYFNNLQTSVIDGKIHVKLTGTALDKLSVSPDQGVYNSITNEIVWNQITNKELADISAGEGGRVSFNIIPRDLSNSQKTIINPNISIDVNMKGKRNSETNVPENIASSANRRIKISSNLSLSGQVIRSTGPFENTGFIPPKAEQPTTYTIVWTVDNTSSTVTDAEVHSSLPPYVKWIGKINPSGEDISYNSVDGQIVWRIGNVDTYAFNSSHRRQVAFQVSLTPSITQVGQIPVLVNQASITAQDDFTLQTLNNSLGQLNTRFSTDQMFKDGDEKVIQ